MLEGARRSLFFLALEEIYLTRPYRRNAVMSIVGDVDIHIQKWDRCNHRNEKTGDLKEWYFHLDVGKVCFFLIAMDDCNSNGLRIYWKLWDEEVYMLELDPVARVLRSPDMSENALFELSKIYYEIHEELRNTLARLLKDAYAY